MPLGTGLNVERSLYAECEESDEAVSLRYLMTAERRLGRRSGQPVQVASVLVVGADVIDAGLCVSLLDAGFWVTAVERSGNLAGNLGGRVYQIYDQAVGRSRMSPALRSARLGHFEIMDDVPTRGEFDVIVDPGWLPVEHLAKFIDSMPASAGSPDVVLSARLGDELDKLSHAITKPLPVVGFHFDKSPHVIKTVEVFAPTSADLQAISLAQDFFHAMKKLPITLSESAVPASVLLRKALSDAAEVLLLHGAEPKRIDGALEAFGFKKGPLAYRDEIGLEVGYIAGEQPATEALIAAGRTGRAAGLGYFRYTKDTPLPRSDSVVLWSLSKVRTDLDIVATEFSDADIVALCVGAMLNVGVDLLANNRVQRASDVDVLAVHALDFPRRKGGPMRAAENFGLFEVKQAMVKQKEKAPGLWTPKELLLELIKYGQGFETMNIPELDPVS
jgi:3-hydroxyacyl-CoA dehydrogenase